MLGMETGIPWTDHSLLTITDHYWWHKFPNWKNQSLADLGQLRIETERGDSWSEVTHGYWNLGACWRGKKLACRECWNILTKCLALYHAFDIKWRYHWNLQIDIPSLFQLSRPIIACLGNRSYLSWDYSASYHHHFILMPTVSGQPK